MFRRKAAPFRWGSSVSSQFWGFGTNVISTVTVQGGGAVLQVPRGAPVMQFGITDPVWTISELVEKELIGIAMEKLQRREVGRLTVINGGTK